MNLRLREGKIPTSILILATGLSLLLIKLEFDTKKKIPDKYYEEKKQAAELSARMQQNIKDKLLDLNFPIDRVNDPNETGMIGIQYSALTSERGDLVAKLTATNPNFAALIFELLGKARLKKGDYVAISLNSSYPALNFSVLSAVKIFDLNPVIISTLTSSMWGANYPDFTYLDMEKELREKNLMPYRSRAITYGGGDDIGRGLTPEAREIIELTAVRNNISLIAAGDLSDAIEKRMQLFENQGAVKLFINIGEHATSNTGIIADNGLIPGYKIKSGSSTIARFSAKGIPVINLIDINAVAHKNKLPVSPIPLPQAGEGALFFTYQYSVVQAVFSVLLLGLVLFIILRYDIAYYFKRRKNV